MSPFAARSTASPSYGVHPPTLKVKLDIRLSYPPEGLGMGPPHGPIVLGQAARSAIRRGLNAMHGKENRKIVLRGRAGHCFPSASVPTVSTL